MKKVIVDSGRANSLYNIEKVEEKYNAKWVGQLQLKDRYGNWTSDTFGDIYYQETPPVEGYSNYFALYLQNGTAYITSGASAVSGIINGVEADDGQIIYSRCRHDMRCSNDKSVWIDGGRDYIRSGNHGRFMQLQIVDGEWYEIEADSEASGYGSGS
jgi:hypothetical protein